MNNARTSATDRSSVAVVLTPVAEHAYEKLTDGQLLAVLDGRPAALVRELGNARSAQLVILDPEDARSLGLP